MIIYADVLLAVNLYINYFLVRCTAILLKKRVPPLRCLAASAAGAAWSLMIFLPELPGAVTVAVKLLLGTGVTFILFGKQRWQDFLIYALCFLAVSFSFAGAMAALWHFAAPMGMYLSNGCTYFDIPIGAAAIITAVIYGSFRAGKAIIDRRKPARHEIVTIRCGSGEVRLDGLADTGNSLKDGFSGKPVVIASLDKTGGIIPPPVLNYLSGSSDGLAGIRLVPCSTVTSEGVIPVFPAEITIAGRSADALVGISRHALKGADCIFDPNIIT